ncbi:Forkhead associated (FHA) domain, binds pSer, pThr, pTyr [Nakamurella panacisegetis]|uniref:Forkhead associated (FHA) domain, binds pSer, pThr, pTyr n=1 Tax=Nakamurella panacisegetis TaxID=1090615 RepID=A0A1H0KPE4_9ACTN|nr:FHA domain-containing protein [Nakamurella panacisegetis]SDO57735.1 Forkhead associated (FHA) domain, binds pSer, pThr, pTyr [Nakamurella panacisegetis]
MPALILQLTRVGFLILLWLFVLAAVRVVRSDLKMASDPRTDSRPARTTRKEAHRPAPLAAGSMVPAILVVTAGSLAGTRLRLGSGTILIGRAEDSTLVLDDDYASTRHARIVQQGNGYAVEDLGSTNGTYLDRTRITAPTPVPVGVPIRIGRTVIELRP